MSDNLAALSGSGPSLMTLDLDPEPGAREDHPLVCVDRASEGAQGANGAGADALVERFADGSGAGGGSGYLDTPSPASSSCADDALRALGTCAETALLALRTRGGGLLLSGASCAGDLMGYLECLAGEEAARKP
jgi:hypothetical protein